MKLYIANSTRQDFMFYMKVAEIESLVLQHVSSGRQVEIPSLSQGQVTSIIQHLERFGAVPREKVRGKVKDFDGIIYADKPITEDEYHYGNEEVVDKAQNRSVTEATKAALASDKLSRKVRVNGREARRSVVSFEEEIDKKNKLAMSVDISPENGQSDKLRLN